MAETDVGVVRANPLLLIPEAPHEGFGPKQLSPEQLRTDPRDPERAPSDKLRGAVFEAGAE